MAFIVREEKNKQKHHKRKKPKQKMRQGRKTIKKGYKKAIITLKKGQSIDLTTGI